MQAHAFRRLAVDRAMRVGGRKQKGGDSPWTHLFQSTLIAWQKDSLLLHDIQKQLGIVMQSENMPEF